MASEREREETPDSDEGGSFWQRASVDPLKSFLQDSAAYTRSVFDKSSVSSQQAVASLSASISSLTGRTDEETRARSPRNRISSEESPDRSAIGTFFSHTFSDMQDHLRRAYTYLRDVHCARALVAADQRDKVAFVMEGETYEYDCTREGDPSRPDVFEPPLSVRQACSLPRLTYRSHMVTPMAADYTSDSGWGCMLRVLQMILASAFVRAAAESIAQHQGVLSPGGKLPYTSPCYDTAFRQVVPHFADHADAAFSLHSLLKEGGASLPPGVWKGPYQTISVFKRMMEKKPETLPNLRLHLCMDNSILDLATLPSTYPTLVMIPNRLSPSEAMDKRYLPAIQSFFRMKAGFGIAGGRPGAAFYFIGIQGDELLYLDPHQYQFRAIDKRDPATWTEEDFNSYREHDILRLAFQHVSPTCMSTLYLTSKEDLEEVIEKRNELLKAGHPTLFDIGMKLDQTMIDETGLLDTSDNDEEGLQ